MQIIEPCCAQRQLALLREALRKGASRQFEGFGDMSLTELLPAIVMRYSETEMLLAAPSLPDQAAEAVAREMRRRWSRADGKGKLDEIARLTILADLSEEKSPMASQWLTDNPWGDRLRLVSMGQEDTAILLPDFAITGPVNMRYGRHFVATATTLREDVAALWEKYRALTGAPAQDAAEAPVGDAAGEAPVEPAEEEGESSPETPDVEGVTERRRPSSRRRR